MTNRKQAIEAALREQIAAQERSEESREQQWAESCARNPELRKVRRLVTKSAAESRFAKSWEAMRLRHQMEGFVAGWLARSDQFSDYAELFAIWLETQRHTSLREPEPISIDRVSNVLQAIARGADASGAGAA